MDSAQCTHQAAREHLAAGDAEATLRIVGPMLESNPADITAWRIAARATHDLGQHKSAFKNLSSAALALAQERNPIAALAQIKEIEQLGGSAADTLQKVAAMYAAGSSRVEEGEISPPPLPAATSVEPWGPELERDQVVSRAGDAMAMAWGAALTAAEREDKLPYVPLLSALDQRGFVQLFDTLVLEVAEPDATVVEQGSTGSSMYIVADGSVVVQHTAKHGEPTELARLGPGAFFGEMALVSTAPRAAAVRAAERVVLLRADKRQLEELARRTPVIGDVLIAFCHARMLENLMRVSPVLAPVPPAKRPGVIARFDTDYRTAGETIIEEDQEGPGLFLIVSGSVRISRKEGDEVMVITELSPGDLFGEISLLMSKPSTATVTAVESTALLYLSREEFHEATKAFPELLKGAYDIAVDREEQNRTILGHPTIEADDLIMV